jgi:purine-nucleoside phosphorylase
MRGTPDPRTGRATAGDPAGELSISRWRNIAWQLGETIAAVHLSTTLRPRVAIVLGSGLGGVADRISLTAPGEGDSPGAVFETSSLPHWPRSTVPGHAGRLVLGYWSGVPVAALRGRAHRYEGYAVDRVTYGVRVLAALGAKILFLTNASGSMNPDLAPGSLVLARDHLNFQGTRGLLALSELPASLAAEAGRPKPAYSPRMQNVLRRAAAKLNIPLAEGVLMGGIGPAYETAAEIRAARLWGADVACMSTVMEAVVAAKLGMEVGVVSCVTNFATGLSPTPLTHDEVTEVADRVGASLERLLGEAVREAAG